MNKKNEKGLKVENVGGSKWRARERWLEWGGKREEKAGGQRG
jgi:hypothetical protein